MADVFLKRTRKRRIEAGNPWVFRSEVDHVKGEPGAGDRVVVRNHQGHFLAQGFYHPQSQITVRVASYDESEPLDQGWLRRRITAAWSLRKRFLPGVSACRAVYGEADGLPGLIVDKYGAVAVVQILSSALDGRRESLPAVLRDVLGVTAVYERSDAHARELEGLEPRRGWLLGDGPQEVEITENGLRFFVDVVDGQKTGHFFDQRDNRRALAPLVRWGAAERPRPDQRFQEGSASEGGALGSSASDGGRVGAQVLDCFAHTGAFSVYALHYGAAHATVVDISEQAVGAAQRNLAANGCADRSLCVVANAFDLLREYEREKREFDVVVLDPPAFAKNRAAIESALRGYKEINLRGMRLVRDGGFLVTSSCSSPISRAVWLDTILDAAIDARKLIRRMELGSAAKDHPVLAAMPENDYLKFAAFEVRSR